MNLWMKRAIGAAALGGGLLALGAGAAGAQEISADATARLGRPTSAQVRVCADGRVLSRLLGCTDRAGGTVQAGRGGDGSGAIRPRVRVPRAAGTDNSIGTRRGRPATTASGQASATRRPGPGRRSSRRRRPGRCRWCRSRRSCRAAPTGPGRRRRP